MILLNGPSSSGKSTLAEALREQITAKQEENYGIVSIDGFLRMSPDRPICEDDVYDISEAMGTAMLELLKTSPGIIVDHVITSERIFDVFCEFVRPFRLFMVHVTCSPEELARREAERGDRPSGSAEASSEYLYPRDGYHLTVDTGSMTAEECASLIYEKVFAEGDAGRFFRVISNQVRFGCGHMMSEGRLIYFAWHGYPDRNDDYFTTSEITKEEFESIQQEYPREISADRDTAESFRRRYVDGHRVLLEGWNKLL